MALWVWIGFQPLTANSDRGTSSEWLLSTPCGSVPFSDKFSFSLLSKPKLLKLFSSGFKNWLFYQKVYIGWNIFPQPGEQWCQKLWDGRVNWYAPDCWIVTVKFEGKYLISGPKIIFCAIIFKCKTNIYPALHIDFSYASYIHSEFHSDACFQFVK